MNTSVLVSTPSHNILEPGVEHSVVWHAIGLPIVLMLASHFAWGEWMLWKVNLLSVLVGITLLCYVVTAWVNHKMLRFPVAKGSRIILANASLAFMIVLTILTFGGFDYSRSFLLAAYFLTLTWQWLGFFLLESVKPHLAIMQGEMTNKLVKLRAVEWEILAQPARPVTAAGVVVDANVAREPEWIHFFTDCALRGLPVYDAGSVYETMTGRALLNHDANNLAEQCTPPSLYLTIKQMVDVVLVMASLPIVLPLIGLIALLIRLDSPGPAFFWQERVGKAGKIFCMVKFRTMDISDDQGTPRFAVAEDHRITRLGRWLRRFRLDELPQIWNVLRGEMSLIGPRPEQVPFAHLFAREIPLYPCRHLVKPGISGWAQVNQGYAAGPDETRIKLAYDLYYVKHCSFWLDALIALRTPRTIQTGHGAR